MSAKIKKIINTIKLFILLPIMIEAKVDYIKPADDLIIKCTPDNYKKNVEQSLENIKTVHNLSKTLLSILFEFAQNATIFVDEIYNINKQVFNKNNIALEIKDKEEQNRVREMLLDKTNGIKYFLKYLRLSQNKSNNQNNTTEYLKIVGVLNDIFLKKEPLTLNELNYAIELLNQSTIKISIILRSLKYLSYARKKIKHYDIVLEGLEHQFLKISTLVNAINFCTQYLRGNYLILAKKGICNPDQLNIAINGEK